ncbi:MAG: amidohydrolase family protein [Bacteroidota bacterium]
MKFLSFLFLLFLVVTVNAQTKQTWITNIDIINTSTGKVIPGQTVVIEDSTIRQIMKAGAKIKIPDSATVINGTGKYIMPGLIDAHIHFFQSGGLYTRPDALDLMKIYSYEKDQQWIWENQDELMRRYLVCGITTVIDVGGPFSNYEVRKKNAANTLSPNAYVTGPLISTYLPKNLDEKDPPIIKVNTEEEARELVRKQLPYKPDFIKIWYIVLPGQPAEKTLSIVKATIEESHKYSLKVAVHATEYETAKLAVNAGCDILVHSVDDKVLDPLFLQLLKTKKVTYIPTAIVASKYDETFTQQHRISLHEQQYANPFMLGTLFDLQHIPVKDVGFDYKKLRTRLLVPSKEDSTILQNLNIINHAGINISAGTDAGNIGTQHGASFYTEMLAMKQAGMNNAEILRSATINTAIGFGKESEVGSIEKSKLANMLILNKNPLDSLGAVNDAVYIINRGKIIKKDTLLLITPESLVQQQVNAYNLNDPEAFLVPYSDSIEAFIFPHKKLLNGKKGLMEMYKEKFDNMPLSHMQILDRIKEDNIVIDKTTDQSGITSTILYTIENNKIRKIYFIYKGSK